MLSSRRWLHAHPAVSRALHRAVAQQRVTQWDCVGINDCAPSALPRGFAGANSGGGPLVSPFDSVVARMHGRDNELPQVSNAAEAAARQPEPDAQREPRAAEAQPSSMPAAAAVTPSPAGPSPASNAPHWLERSFPAAHEWLQRKNRQWWVRGIKARCRQLPQLVGREELITRLISEKYDAILEKHRHRVVDGRTETHLQVAALLLASYQTLSPWVRNDQELLQLLREHMGAQASPGLRMLLRGTLLVSRSPFAWQSARLRALQLDQGAAFTSELEQGDREASLTISGCFYHDLLSAEGVPQLAAAACCSLDCVWFEGLEWHGVAFEQPSCLARGDSCCQLRVRKLD